MTEASAQLRSVRIAPRKLRLVADAIKGKNVEAAESELRYIVKRGSRPLLKLLKSAVANAYNNVKIPQSAKLYVRDLRVDEGRAFKRSMPRARGRASLIRKRTSHVKLVLGTR